MDVRDRVNAQWADLIVRKRSFPPNMRWTEQAKQMFFLVSYNIDKFRDFVFESSFLQRTPVEEQTLSRLRGDDAALLEFGLGWLKGILFKDKQRRMEQAAAGRAGGFQTNEMCFRNTEAHEAPRVGTTTIRPGRGFTASVHGTS